MKDIKNIKDDFPKPADEKEKSINALPEYKIRTMKDDLAKISFKELQKEAKEAEGIKFPERKIPAPPEKLPVAPSFAKAPKGRRPKAPLPSTEELVTEKVEEFPPAPTPPKLAPALAKAVAEERIPRPRRRPKTLIILVIIALVLFGVGWFFYWQGIKPEELPTEVGTPTEVGAPRPSESLIPVKETKIISLTNEISLFELSKQEVELDQPINSFKRMAILKNETEFLSLADLFGQLEITSPPYVLTELEENYNLLIFNQETGKRLGLIIKIKNPQTLKEQMSFWEETMLEDFKNFYPSQTPGQAASETFLDDIYREIDIRYTNLPYSTLTINYTIINNLLIIGTSKETMYTAIDRVVDNL